MENKPRYAIVRVDINCPKDVCGEEDFCFLSKGKTLADMCDYCEFLQEKRIIGDTKEQLITKVQQALFKSIFTEELQKAVAIEEQKRIYKQYRPMAKKVVEFLGVEE